MYRTTQNLQHPIMAYDAGHITKDQLILLFQDCIDNGDILEPDNELYFAATIMPLIDAGTLNPSAHTEQLARKMDSLMADKVDQILKRGSYEQSKPKTKPFWRFW